MANKNTRQLRIRLRAAGKQGEHTVVQDTPVKDYHNHDKVEMTTRKFPTAIPDKEGRISFNNERNSVQCVYRNKDKNGVGSSVTSHEQATKTRHMIFPNHRYLEYRKVA